METASTMETASSSSHSSSTATTTLSSSSSSPEVRLVLLPKDPHGSETATIADEIVIYCQQGPAYRYEKRIFYVLALENIVTKERIPLLSTERITMKIYDERDPYDGVAMLNRPGLTSAPWKNYGLVYFQAIQFCQVGQYRITFQLNTKRFRNGAGVKGLQYIVVATDPEWEAEQLNAILEDLNKLDNAKKVTTSTGNTTNNPATYALRGLTKTEKDWLISHSTHLPPDPPNHLLVQLAHDMHTALHTPAVKDISIIAPLFESESKRNARVQTEKEKRLMLAKHGMMIARLVMNEEKKNQDSTTNGPSTVLSSSASSSSADGTSNGNSSSSKENTKKGSSGYANLSLQAKKELLQRMQNELLGTTAPVLQDNTTPTTIAEENGNSAMDTTENTVPSTTITAEETKIITDTLATVASSSSSSSSGSTGGRRKVPRKISHRGDDEGPYQPWHLADRIHWNEAYERARKWSQRYTEERHHWIEINRLYRAAVANGANEQERKKIVSRKLKGQSSDKIITRRSDCYRVHRFEGSLAAGETIVLMDRFALPRELVARWKISATEWLRQAEDYRKNKFIELENDWNKRVTKAKKDYERRLSLKRHPPLDTGTTLSSPRASPFTDDSTTNTHAESPVTITSAANESTDVTMNSSTKDSPVSQGVHNLSTSGASSLSLSSSRLASSASSSSLNDPPEFDEQTMVKGKRPDSNDSSLQQALLVEGLAKVSGNTVPYIQSLKIFLESRYPVLNKQQSSAKQHHNNNNNNNASSTEGNARKRSRVSKDGTNDAPELSTVSHSSDTGTTTVSAVSSFLPSVRTPNLTRKYDNGNGKYKLPSFIRRTDTSLGYPASDGRKETVYTQITLLS